MADDARTKRLQQATHVAGDATDDAAVNGDFDQGGRRAHQIPNEVRQFIAGGQGNVEPL